MNRSIIVGRLTRDPELRYSGQGVAVCNFTVAVNRPFDKEKADFINVVCFKKTAENVANYLKKGSLAGVDGRIQTRSYDNNEGRRVFITEVVAESVQFLESRGNGGGQQQQSNQQQNNYPDPFANDGQPIDISDDDLPFG
ncbi:single-stranded DNA-binding protein [Halalkalibacter krulwichiae]|uniref:Single-stranded DNA-binding protein n=1 Tax=Halalkalibacter krulwichiae TaxID=199441 RepID=A0A1X9MB35_9BACI|nr:single-stranded DNA-binding protein [Halalkalibacter krulwichiae]ARK28771.1 Single-stranded DNA-binding protein ssb [Halalkalibacter krulwichiae]